MIYLDYNATTPLSDSVKQTIRESLNLFVNPSSMYKESEVTKKKIQQARKNIASLINAEENQVIFTGCATESNNAVVSSCVDGSKRAKKHIIVSSVEHSAIFETAKHYQKYRNIDVTFIPVDNKGRVDLNKIKDAVSENTVLVSIMLVNNEIGNVYPIKDIVKIVKEKNPNTMVHTDATQAIGKMDVDVEDLGVDFLTLSGHKFYAPKGIGALYVKKLNAFTPFMIGGHQEKGNRAGTENLLSIIAIGQAAEDIAQFRDYGSIQAKRDQFEKNVLKFISGSKILGDTENRICNTSCILIDGYSGIDICEMVNEIEDVCISSGSACNSTILEPSHVMKAMGINKIPIRVSIGKDTTDKELTKCLQALIKATRLLKRN